MIEEERVLCAINIRGKQKYKRNIIFYFRHKNIPFFNLHPGILPEYKGLFYTFWVIKNNNENHGCTLHEIDDGFDTGRLIGADTTKIDYKKSVLRNVLDLIPLTDGLIKDYLSKLIVGNRVKPTPQEKCLGNYYSVPDTECLINFIRKEKCLVNKDDFIYGKKVR